MPPPVPYRSSSFLGVSVYGFNQNVVGTAVRVYAGNDALVGNFGLRVSGDIPVSGLTEGTTISAVGLYRVTLAAIDGYFGVGGGYNLTNQATFGETLVGVNYRFVENFAVFAEGRQHYYFNGTNTNLNSITAGLQFRF